MLKFKQYQLGIAAEYTIEFRRLAVRLGWMFISLKKITFPIMKIQNYQEFPVLEVINQFLEKLYQFHSNTEIIFVKLNSTLLICPLTVQFLVLTGYSHMIQQ